MPDALEKQKILSSLASPLAVRDERIKPLAVPLFFIRNRMHSADTSAMSCRCNGQPPSLLTSHPPWAKPLRGDFRIASAPPYTNRRLSETESTITHHAYYSPSKCFFSITLPRRHSVCQQAKHRKRGKPQAVFPSFYHNCSGRPSGIRSGRPSSSGSEDICIRWGFFCPERHISISVTPSL